VTFTGGLAGLEARLTERYSKCGAISQRRAVGEPTKLAVVINTPAQVHLFKNLVSRFRTNGHETLALARDYGDTLQLLSELGLEAKVFSNGHGAKLSKLARTPVHLSRICAALKDFRPDMILGVGADTAVASRLIKKPGILFNDSEPIPVQLLMMSALADSIITPSCFTCNLGRNHIRVETYKELAYLHPNHFTPDSSVIDALGLTKGERYALLRFNGFRAVHDLGITGFSLECKRKLVETLEERMRVFISSEIELPTDLQEYSLSLPKACMHSLVAQASLVVADTQTIVTESAVLGTPVVRFNGFVGENDMGNFIELEKRYGMVFSFNESEAALSKAIELSDTVDAKPTWMKKRERLLRDKIDLTEYLVKFVEDYPDSKLNALRAS
jgi:hypothetical protein